MGGGGFATLERFPGGGGGAPPFFCGPGGGGLLLLLAPPADEALPVELVASSLAGFGKLGGAGSFFPSPPSPPRLGKLPALGIDPKVEGRRSGMFGNGLDGARLKDGLLPSPGGGGGRLLPGGGGGLFATPLFDGGIGVGLGDLSGGGGGLGDDPVLTGLVLSLGGATGGVVGVEGNDCLAMSLEALSIPGLTRCNSGCLGVGLGVGFGAGLGDLVSPSSLVRLLGGGGGGLALLVAEESLGSEVLALPVLVESFS